MAAFTQEKLIRFQHCDPAGLIFYPKAFELVGEVIEDWFTEFSGVTPHEFHMTESKSLPTVKTCCEFFGQVHVSDRLRFDLVVDDVGRSSIAVAVTASAEGSPRFRINSTLVHVGRKADGSYGALPFPDDMRDRLQHYGGGPAAGAGTGEA